MLTLPIVLFQTNKPTEDTLITSFIYNLVIISIVAWLLPGIQIDGLLSAILVTVVFALVNSFVSPFITIVTLPLTFLTLGLFLIVIDVIMVYITAAIVPGFQVAGFWSAFFFSLITSFFGTIFD